MGLITKQKSWVDEENVTYTDMNANFDTLYNAINGGIDNNNIDASAAIAESKLAFDTASGHNHDGTNSKLIPANAIWTVVGTLTTSTDAAPWLYIKNARTITAIAGIVKTAPTGDDIIIDIEKSGDNGATWTSIWNTTPANRLTISATNREGTQTSFDTTAVSAGDYLRVAIDQVGSSVAGADLTVNLTL